MSYIKVSPWIDLHEVINGTDYVVGACRTYEGSDPSIITERVAFIEKTPRVRIRSGRYINAEDWLHWAEGPFKGDGPHDQEARNWCDAMLLILGYNV